MIARDMELIRSEFPATFHLAGSKVRRMLAQMKVRSPLLSLALALLGTAAGQAAQSAQSTWVGSTDNLISNPLNWTGDPPSGADLIFSTTLQPIILVDAALAANSLTFNGAYPAYTFSSANGSGLSIGIGGINVEAQSGSPIDFTSSVPIQLSTSQMWNVNGQLRVAGPVSSVGTSTTVLTKTGTGTLTLAGNNTFSGGVLLQQGTLLVETGSTGVNGTIDAGSLGLGGLTISANTTFGAAKPNVVLSNAISLDSGAVLASGSHDERGRGLLLTGAVTTTSKDTVLSLSGSNPLTFSGTLDGPANTVIRFQSGSTGTLDGAALAGVTTANVTSLVADHAALYFVTPSALPSTVTVQAVNNGYVGIASTARSPSLSVNVVLDRIVDPGAFAGTFGFDTEPDSGAPHIYSENLDFSAFTHASFRIGSATEAVLTGEIAPPISDGTTAYRFGSGGGHLFVQSNLGDTLNPGTSVSVPTAVEVSSPAGEDISGIILGGLNTFSGTLTAGTVTSNLRVDRAMVILDSAGALPAGASFSLGGVSYIGYTEATGFATFADFLSRVATGGYDANSVFGIDSHAFIQDKMTRGDENNSNASRVVTEGLDLRSLSSGFLGTLTRVRIDGDVRAPSTGILQITGVSEGALTITSALATKNSDGTPNVSSVVVGYPSSSGVDEFGESKVELTGASTYTGGTTLQSGGLLVGGNSTVNSGVLVSGPLGTGTLTVASNPDGVVLASNSETGVTLFNAILLNGQLQLGSGDPQQNPSAPRALDPHPLILAGNISGEGGIDAYGQILLSGSNSYTGGTHGHNGILIFASPASVPTVGTLQSDITGYIGLQSAPTPTSAQTGFIARFDPASAHTIGFDTDPSATTPTEFSDNLTLAAFTSTSTRIGSSSVAKLSGTLTPAESTYRFGGGGGYLEVSSALTGGTNAVEVSSPHGASLTLRLSGTNTYLGPTTVSNSAIIFGPGAISAGSTFAMDPNGYIGSDDASLDANFSPFLNRFAPDLNQGTIGFDAAPGSTGRIITSVLDLSRFTTADFSIGTSTALTFGAASTITLPTSATAYRFSGYKGGRVQIDTVLSGARGLVIGNPTSLMSQVSPTGVTSSVVLNAANTFTGGTELFSGDLYLGPSSVVSGSIVSGPLGTGTLTVQPIEFSNGNLRPTLRPLSGAVTLDNPIVLNSVLGVASDLTLAGSISGAGGIYKVDAGTLTVAGDNSSWAGSIFINEGNVTFTQNTSAGTGMLRLGGLVASTATFTSAAPAIGPLAGGHRDSQLVLAANSVLNISQAGPSAYYGEIIGDGASMTVQGFDPNVANQLILGGANLHTGGTTIGSNAIIIAAHDNALGTTGGVTLNQGGLAVAQGVTTRFAASHPLTLNGGTLGGTGTLAFDTSLSIKSGANGAVVLSPGFNTPGKLNLSFPTGATLILDSGGRYHWKLMDATNTSSGWDTIVVTGGVKIDATAIAPFDLTISTVSGTSSGEAANFDVYSSYSWTLLTTTSAITGFDPTKFNLDTTNFLNRTLDGTFSVALDGAGTSLMLNYTAAAIPEPSTWAMMIIGVVVIAYSSFRRRRS